MRLSDRGTIRPGAYADLVLLDPEHIDPGTDYRDQRVAPEGVAWVFLNGQPALREGSLTGARSGKALRAYGHRKP
jgi:N-acyl-D-aspartate/D-glutamate deacylase